MNGDEFVCLCDEGYTLRSDKRTCRGEDKVADHMLTYDDDYDD